MFELALAFMYIVWVWCEDIVPKRMCILVHNFFVHDLQKITKKCNVQYRK